MAIYRDQEQLYKVLGEFFERCRRDAVVGPKLAESKIIVRFIYTDPVGEVTINFRDPVDEPDAYGAFVFGPCDLKPDVTMKQSADFSHKFWHGKANIVAALATRQVVASGSVPKALALLPAIRPTYAIYPQVLRDLGLGDLVLN